MSIKKYFRKTLVRHLIEKRLFRGIGEDISRACKRFRKKTKKAWRKLQRKIDVAIAHLAWKPFAKHTPIVNNRVMFRTFQHKYTCNPKYVCEEMLKLGDKFEAIWVYSKKTGDFSQYPENVKLVRIRSYEYYKAMASSHYWIDNGHNSTWEPFPKKKEQVLINLWHGSMGFKRIDPCFDSSKERHRSGKRAAKLTNYCVPNSKFEENVFRTTYWQKTEFLKFGHARNDILFSSEKEYAEIRARVCERLNLDPKCKFLLYAPTFRDDATETKCFDIDYPRLKTALEKRFGGEWIILQRFHLHTLLNVNLDSISERSANCDYIVSVSDYTDMQELLAIADAGITDYSSWACDYVLTKRPAFLFTTDYDSYVDERGFYYDLKESPFPICYNNKDLIENIENFDNEKYLSDIDRYLDMLGCYETGTAAKQLVNKLVEDMNKPL